MLGPFRILLHELRTPGGLRANALVRRLFPGGVGPRDLDTLRDGIELNLTRLPERERTILSQHDIGHIPARDVRRVLYISARQFSSERRRGLARLFEYVIGDLPSSPAWAAAESPSPRGAQPPVLRERDVVEALRSSDATRDNPLLAALPENERRIVQGLVDRTPVRDIAAALKLSVRHVGRLRAKAIAALGDALLKVEPRSRPLLEARPGAEAVAPLVLPLTRSLVQAGAYAGALGALDDALRSASNNTELVILNLEAADIELQAQLGASASDRLQKVRQLLCMGRISSPSLATCEFRTSILEALLSRDYFVALERCEQALRSFRSWLSQHGDAREASPRIVWALCCIAEIARTAGLPSRARSAVIEAEQLVERQSLQYSWVVSHLKLQRACADAALFGSLGDTLATLSDQFEKSSDSGRFADASRIALCIVDFTSSLGRHADALSWVGWIAQHVDRLSPLDRVVLALNSADALTRAGRPGDALRLLTPFMKRFDRGVQTGPSAAVEIRAAEALVLLGCPREALGEALIALEQFDKKKALPGAARAHAVAAQCYGALGSWGDATKHLRQSTSLAERFASPAQLLQVYTTCATVVDDARIQGTVKEMRRFIAVSTATLPAIRPASTGP